MRVLYKMYAGMGDVVQFRCLLKHLKQKDSTLYICAVTRPGLHTILEGVADECFDILQPQPWKLEKWDKQFFFHWEHPDHIWDTVPNTKITECLERYFSWITPDPKLYRYEIQISDKARERARTYTDTIPKPYGVIHYNGYSGKEEKNLSEWEALLLARMMIAEGITPVILEWEPLPSWIDQKEIFCPGADHSLWTDVRKKKSGNPQVIAALIDEAEIFFGVDSGPGHVAGCDPITTPSYIFWTGHHPLFAYDLTRKNVVHIVPTEFELEPSSKSYFDTAYSHYYYSGDLTDYIESLVQSVVFG